MDNSDLDHAKRVLAEEKLAFVIVKNRNVIAKSTERGVAPFFSAVASFTNLAGASLADKVVGKAVAFLSVHAGIVAVYTPLASEPAVTVLREHGISVETETVVPMILNRNKDGQCPIEQLIGECGTSREAYALLREKLRDEKE